VLNNGILGRSRSAGSRRNRFSIGRFDARSSRALNALSPSENARVLAAVIALRSSDLARLEILTAASHASLRDDYQQLEELFGGFIGGRAALARWADGAPVATDDRPSIERLAAVSGRVDPFATLDLVLDGGGRRCRAVGPAG